MILDDTIFFNHRGTLSTIDDHEVCLRHLLQRNARSTLEDRRHLLSVCEEMDI